MPESSGVPAVSMLVPAGPALVKQLAVRGRRQAERYGRDQCAEAYVRLYDVAAAR
jgi:hypothetical protein